MESITLWILGGLASLTQFSREWDREFWIAVAGPVTSVLLAGVCWAAMQTLSAASPVLVFVVGWLAVTNVVLAAFDMLPAFPMDGGRVLRALLDRLLGVRRTDLAVRDGDEIVGVVTAGSLRSIEPADYATTPVTELLRTDLPTIDVGTDTFDALVALNEARSDVAIVESDGRAVGTLSQADFAAALNLRRGTMVAM